MIPRAARSFESVKLISSSQLDCSSEQSSCDELMEFKHIQTRAQPEESLKHNHSCASTGYMKKQPIIVGAWSMAVTLWQRFEYYY